jgi:hypothetical protein
VTDLIWWGALVYTLVLLFVAAITAGFVGWCVLCFVRAWFPLDLSRYRWYWTLRRWF